MPLAVDVRRQNAHSNNAYRVATYASYYYYYPAKDKTRCKKMWFQDNDGETESLVH